MCFSTQASLLAGTGLTIVGFVSTRQARDLPSDRFFAIVPAVFAAHQLIEAAIWIALPQVPKPPYTSFLGYAFTFIAFCFWPVLIPYAVFRMEQRPQRKRLLFWSCIIGAIVAAFFLVCLLVNPPTAQIVKHSIRYRVSYPLRLVVQNLYGVAVTGSCLVSSHRWVNVFGVALAVAYYYSFYFYRPTYESVWCYFAALLSVCVLLHLRQRNRSHKNAAQEA